MVLGFSEYPISLTTLGWDDNALKFYYFLDLLFEFNRW